MIIQAADHLAEVLVADAKLRWLSGEEDVDAQAFLARHPEISSRRSLVLDVAYEEFCQHVDATDSDAVEAFLDRFPSLRNSLRKQIEVHRVVAEYADMLPIDAGVDELQPGEEIFDFTVLEELGCGTFARVYLCTQSGLGDRHVVVKVGLEGAYEADMLGKLSHRNIMPVHSVHHDEQSGISALCMPFRGRSTLCDVLDIAFSQGSCPQHAGPILAAASRWTQRRDSYDEDHRSRRRLQRLTYVDAILELGIRLAEALQHAHDQGILHGDLKPSNVLVTPAGTALVLDFNLACQVQQWAELPGGTLPYMAPEQMRAAIGERADERPQVDVRADIFSLGAMLYELLSGRLPFPPAKGSTSVRESARQLLDAHDRGPRPLSELNPQVGKGVAACIEGCLSTAPGERPGSMADLAADLRRCLAPQRRAGRWLRLHRRLATVMAVLLAAVATGVAAYFVGRAPYHERQYQAGMQAFHAAKWADATASFDRAVAAEPNFAEAHFARAHVALREENYVLASRDFQTAHQMQPCGRHAAGRAQCLTRMQFYRSAPMFFQEALDDGYTDVGVYNNLAYCEIRNGRFSRARELLSEGIARDPAPYQLYLNRALLELARAQRAQAQLPAIACDDIDRAVEQSPPNGELSYLAAQLHAMRALHDAPHQAPALAHLDMACRRGMRASKQSILQNPDFASLREIPRFLALLSSKADSTTDTLPDLLMDPLSEIR